MGLGGQEKLMPDKAWKSFFDKHSARYDENSFTSATERELEFMSEIIPLESYRKLIDIGCGTGRHSIGLALMGYSVTGVDLSDGMLAVAGDKSRKAGASVRFIRADATSGFPSAYGLTGSFDAAICLCEGSLGLIGTGDDPLSQALSVFGNVHSLLKPGGLFLFTVLNALKMIRQFEGKDISTGRFDPFNVVEWHALGELDKELGEELSSRMVGEKSFTGSELKLMLKVSGFEVLNMWGGTAGAWGRRSLDPDEYEIMVVARRD